MQIGTDLVYVDRIEKAMRHPRFLTRFFTKQEMDTCKNLPYKIAGRWAAKEAVYKCCSDILFPFSPIQIEIITSKNGKPEVILHKELDQGYKPNIVISISHEKNLAMAVAIWNK